MVKFKASKELDALLSNNIGQIKVVLNQKHSAFVIENKKNKYIFIKRHILNKINFIYFYNNYLNWKKLVILIEKTNY